MKSEDEDPDYDDTQSQTQTPVCHTCVPCWVCPAVSLLRHPLCIVRRVVFLVGCARLSRFCVILYVLCAVMSSRPCPTN